MHHNDKWPIKTLVSLFASAIPYFRKCTGLGCHDMRYPPSSIHMPRLYAREFNACAMVPVFLVYVPLITDYGNLLALKHLIWYAFCAMRPRILTIPAGLSSYVRDILLNQYTPY